MTTRGLTVYNKTYSSFYVTYYATNLFRYIKPSSISGRVVISC